jgi:hypothetical protein
LARQVYPLPRPAGLLRSAPVTASALPGLRPQAVLASEVVPHLPLLFLKENWKGEQGRRTHHHRTRLLQRRNNLHSGMSCGFRISTVTGTSRGARGTDSSLNPASRGRRSALSWLSPSWCSRQELHLHWRRSRRRVSAGWTTRAMMWGLPPAQGRRQQRAAAVGTSENDGALTRSCTELVRLPSECIAHNALRAPRMGPWRWRCARSPAVSPMRCGLFRPPLTVGANGARLTFHDWSAWQESHLQPSRLERDASARWANAAKMALPAGLSPATSAFEARRSIH